MEEWEGLLGRGGEGDLWAHSPAQQAPSLRLTVKCLLSRPLLAMWWYCLPSAGVMQQALSGHQSRNTTQRTEADQGSVPPGPVVPG